MLQYSKIWSYLERKQPDGKRIPIKLTFVKISTGELITGENVRFSSFDKKNNLLKFQWSNGQMRSVYKPAILKIDEHDIRF